MAPATTNPARVAQVAQLMEVLKSLTSGEFQRLLSNGDLLKLIAQNPSSDESARWMRHYARGYLPLLQHYTVSSWADLSTWIGQVEFWAVKVSDGTFRPMLEFYRLSGANHTTILRVLREHWTDYSAWYIRVA